MTEAGAPGLEFRVGQGLDVHAPTEELTRFLIDSERGRRGRGREGLRTDLPNNRPPADGDKK